MWDAISYCITFSTYNAELIKWKWFRVPSATFCCKFCQLVSVIGHTISITQVHLLATEVPHHCYLKICTPLYLMPHATILLITTHTLYSRSQSLNHLPHCSTKLFQYLCTRCTAHGKPQFVYLAYRFCATHALNHKYLQTMLVQYYFAASRDQVVML